MRLQEPIMIQRDYQSNTNKLRSVDESAGVTADGTDLEDQDFHNYSYDDIGNLIKDNKEKIAKITWTVYGKIRKVERTEGSGLADLEFAYDAVE